MKKEDNYGSRFLYAEDLLQGGEYRCPVVEISEFIQPNVLRAANGKVIDKPTLKFAGKDKMLVLCNTNVAMAIYCTGEHEREKWIGHRIKLQARIIEAFGDSVVAIRIMPPEGVKVRRSVLKRLGEKAVWNNGEPTTKQPAKAEDPPKEEPKGKTPYENLKAEIGKAKDAAKLQQLRQSVQLLSDDGTLDVEQTRTLNILLDKKQEEQEAAAASV